MHNDLAAMWEFFRDDSYYHQWAVRRTDDKRFNAAIHVGTGDEAKFLCAELNKIHSLRNIVTTDHETKQSFIDRVNNIINS